VASTGEKRECNQQTGRRNIQKLRDYFGKGISFSEIAAAINAQFGTEYTRNAANGRARRMGLAGPEQPGSRPDDVSRPANPHPPRLHEAVERHIPRAQRPGRC
jgi:GcrA cell cycle regulator